MMNVLSPAMKAASAFAMGGVAFAAANLLLARNLSTQAFGEYFLVLALTIMCMPLGPLGLDSVVLRHRPGPQRRLLAYSLFIGGIGGLALAAAAAGTYALDRDTLLLVAVAITAGSAARMAAAVYQSVKLFRWSLWLMQGQNFTLVVAAVASGIFVGMTSKSVILIYSVHWIVVAILGWYSLLHRSGLTAEKSWRIPWPEVPALFGFLVAQNLTSQIDKLIIPKVLDIEALATFGVLSPLVLAPFKMLQAGVGYTLIPGLKAATSQHEKNQIVLHEARTTFVVVALGVVSAFLIAPWVVELFLQGKYHLSTQLIAAGVFAGVVRVATMFLSSIVTALGKQTQLTWMNRSSWLALAVSITGAVWGAQWGLAGFIFAYTAGMLLRAFLLTGIASQSWKCSHHSSAAL